jgi:hypothetical protein
LPSVSTPRGSPRCKPPKIFLCINFWFVWVQSRKYYTHILKFLLVSILENLAFVHFRI